MPDTPSFVPELRQRPADPRAVVPPASTRGRIVRGVLLALVSTIALALVAMAIFPGVFAPFDPDAIALTDTLKPPSAAHWLGTDQLGRDMLSRVIWGSRVSLFVAFCAVLLAGIGGGLFGIAAGYLGGAVDAVAMRLADIQLALPAVILALVLVGAIGFSMFNLIVVLSLANWARFARVTRSEALSLRQRDFVLLAKLAGASTARIVLTHIVPNVVNTFIVLATLDIGIIIILEATLSFLGLGVQPPSVSWGVMLADAKSFMGFAWWLALFPGVAIFLSVLSFSSLGDWLHTKFDPRTGL